MLHRRKPDLVSRVIDGEVVILDRQAGRVHQLNATASCIWDAFDGERSPEDIARFLAGRFEHAPDAGLLLQDVHAALADFQRLGLLVEGPPADGSHDSYEERGAEDGR